MGSPIYAKEYKCAKKWCRGKPILKDREIRKWFRQYRYVNKLRCPACYAKWSDVAEIVSRDDYKKQEAEREKERLREYDRKYPKLGESKDIKLGVIRKILNLLKNYGQKILRSFTR